MKLASVVLSLAMLAGIVYAADAPTAVPDNLQTKLLKAQHDLDALIMQEQEMKLNHDQAVAVQHDIEAKFPEVDKQAMAALKARDAVKDDVLHAMGLDKAKFDIDFKTLTASPKTTTDPVTPSAPEKK